MKFNPNDYVSVKERLAEALPFITDIETGDLISMLTPNVGVVQVKVTIRDKESGEVRTATGTAMFDLARSGKSAQATNPIEDAETSALGRALVHLGFFSGSTDPSREEMLIAKAEVERREAAEAEGRPAAYVEKPFDREAAEAKIRSLRNYKPDAHEHLIAECQTRAELLTLYDSIK